MPAFSGTRDVTDVSAAEVAHYIDWTFFFSAWEIKGRFPKVLDDPKQGEAARQLYENAQELLHKIIDENLLELRGVYGFFPANSEGDDVVVYENEERRSELTRFHMLRQQRTPSPDRPTLCLADFVAPRETGLVDYLGAFAVTSGLGAEELAAKYEAELDDYNAIMVKALADRLAEAFAEFLHQRVRKDWGFPDPLETSDDDLVRERYRGIRPAFGYPACPDHSEKSKLFELLAAESLGMSLTEHFAMTPAASVSGIYFSRPEARYFSVGRVGRDQVEDYARRKQQPIADVERWIRPNLAYEPE
jgi:5-methyltetrahydrofolate--homocysteine methyltransferase